MSMFPILFSMIPENKIFVDLVKNVRFWNKNVLTKAALVAMVANFF